ncbi:Dynactin subunit 2-B [Symbiodinium microadriaticum]|uniref:Dynactin subunit 2-B n=1 Tax=Symbiodinium microadriaticum TaxID=2951 RepID=A0A1Q9EG13_SYMMI|nr:Dynactin subunit 2-B [Symbiodinium microadriaticum]
MKVVADVEVICQRVRLQRTFLHLHQDVGPATKKRKKQAAGAQPEEVPAWETYMQVNGFRPGCQLVQTFLWHCGEDLIFACVPYPLRPDAALLAEALKVPADRLTPCKLREVQNITKMPLFICLPFGLPKGARLVADARLARLPDGEAGWKLDDAMAAATLTLVISSLWHDGLGGFRVTISEIETTSDYEDEKSDPYDAGAAWDHEYKGTCAAEGQELRWLVADWKGKGHFDGLPPPELLFDCGILALRMSPAEFWRIDAARSVADLLDPVGPHRPWSAGFAARRLDRLPGRHAVTEGVFQRLLLAYRPGVLVATASRRGVPHGSEEEEEEEQEQEEQDEEEENALNPEPVGQEEPEATIPGGAANGRSAAKPRRGYEVAPAGFEPPEQRLARLQAEVADLLRLTEASAEKEAAVAELLGGDPGEMSQELKVLEKRLVALSEGSAPWRGAGGKKARGGYAMPASLVSQLDRLASGQASAPASEAPGQVTYQINYAPNAASIGEGAKLAAMESTISEIEKQLGVREPISHFPDLQTAVTQLQKRLALLDSPKLEAIAKGVDKVAKEVEQVLAKKVSQLYDFCHRWSATAASLPQIVARLQSLQALHLQSASFASRLASLEKQQEELAKLLETTTEAVEDLNTGLKENMSIVRDNMKSLEARIQQAVSG